YLIGARTYRPRRTSDRPGGTLGRPGPEWRRLTSGVAQRSVTRDVALFAERFEAVVGNVQQAIQGKPDAIRLALVCLVAEGHLLIEDVPGGGKTQLAKALAASLELSWHRIQFTPDLLPSDVTGV